MSKSSYTNDELSKLGQLIENHHNTKSAEAAYTLSRSLKEYLETHESEIDRFLSQEPEIDDEFPTIVGYSDSKDELVKKLRKYTSDFYECTLIDAIDATIPAELIYELAALSLQL